MALPNPNDGMSEPLIVDIDLSSMSSGQAALVKINSAMLTELKSMNSALMTFIKQVRGEKEGKDTLRELAKETKEKGAIKTGGGDIGALSKLAFGAGLWATFSELWQNLRGFRDNWDMISANFKKWGLLFGKIAPLIGNLITKFAPLAGAFGKSLKAIPVLGNVILIASAFFDAVVGFWDSYRTDGDLFKAFGQGIARAVSGVINGFISLLDFIPGVDTSGVRKQITEFFDTSLLGLTNTITSFFSGDIIGGITQWMTSFRDLWKQLGSIVIDTIDGIVKIFGGEEIDKEKWKTAFNDAIDKTFGFIIDMINGITAFIRMRFGFLVDLLTESEIEEELKQAKKDLNDSKARLKTAKDANRLSLFERRARTPEEKAEIATLEAEVAEAEARFKAAKTARTKENIERINRERSDLITQQEIADQDKRRERSVINVVAPSETTVNNTSVSQTNQASRPVSSRNEALTAS